MNPRATYRLQFGPEFGFAEAAALAPYLAALGVSHVYLAPVFAARPGSTHGYDVVDPGVINPELGGEAGFRALAAALRRERLGILLDIVPNHMGIGGASNRFWLDVLAWGKESRFAGWFDIDWEEGGGKLLLPVLGEAYGPALASGALALRFEDGAFAVWAHGTHKLPVSPRDTGRILRAGEGSAALVEAAEALEGAPASDPGWAALATRLVGESCIGDPVAAFREPAALDALIAMQAWRPAKFSLDRDALNYRRFFAISDLAAVRVEDPGVFEATQRLALSLVDEGLVDGLRIDHIDGLRDPKAYLRRLRAEARRPFWLLVEKILAEGESLPEDWGSDGTTGYEVANLLVGLLVDPDGEAAMARVYREFTGREAAPQAVVWQSKREAVERMLGSELAALTKRFLRLAERSGRFYDLGSGAVRVAMVEIIAALGVYRTYADADGIGADDRARVRAAVAEARRAAAWVEPDAFALVEAVLTLEQGEWPDEDGMVLEAALRFQQLSGPAMAKGLEDTALYRYNRLIALNEVGSEPGRFGTTLAAFHAANAARLAEGARGLLGTSTHDTKRGEDARARIAALPRHAEAWAKAVREWHALVADPAEPIDRNDEYFFYQLLLGAWPMQWREEPDGEALAAFAERVQAAMLKSVREAGENTRWVFGEVGYEARLAGFIGRALAPEGAFLRSFRAFEATVARDGAANALIEAALKLTLPGVPDIYRGAEVWEQSLVDPDNRRPVDFADLAQRLQGLPPGAAAFTDWTSPTAKLALTARLLAVRRERPELFAAGSYEPLELGAGLCGFRRRYAESEILVLAALPYADGAARVDLEGASTDLLTGTELKDARAVEVFVTLPVAVLFRP